MGGGPNSAGRAGGGKHVPGGGAPFSYIPPSAIQNAMMTKDKKPFTYTPGGIDFLAEIRSPRMQRRISKNAADEGVSSHPHPTPTNPPGSSPTPSHLSPQALMAMQPQIAVPVFPPTPQQMPVLHSPAMHLPVTPPTPTVVATSPLPPPPPPSHQNYIQQQSVESSPPQPMRINLKPAVPQFLQSQPQTQSPEQMFEEIMNSLSARSASSQAQSSIPATYTPQQPVVAPAPVAPSAPTTVSTPERRNTQLGSIYIPPVNNNAASGSPNTSNNANSNGPSGPLSPLASAQLAKAPMPWMNSQNRPSSSPTPVFVHNQQQQHERVIPVDREENVKPFQTAASASGNVRVVPIAVEGGHAGGTATRAPPTPQRSVSSVKDETVHPPWHNAQGKVIPIYLESSGSGVNTSMTPVTVQRQPDAQQSYQPQQQQQAPWRTQAAANANQIASMMDE